METGRGHDFLTASRHGLHRIGGTVGQNEQSCFHGFFVRRVGAAATDAGGLGVDELLRLGLQRGAEGKQRDENSQGFEVVATPSRNGPREALIGVAGCCARCVLKPRWRRGAATTGMSIVALLDKPRLQYQCASAPHPAGWAAI
jgi:hypothetical protein